MRRDTRFQFEDLLVLLESKDGGSGNEEVLREVLQSDERPLGGETSSLQNGRFLSGGFAFVEFLCEVPFEVPRVERKVCERCEETSKT